MAIDLTGGYDVSLEYSWPESPPPGARDASVMCISDDRGYVGFPRFSIEAIAPGERGASEGYGGSELQWETPDLKLNLAFADGRVFRLREPGKRHSTLGPDGQHSVLGAGPLEFRCVEPFRMWTASFQGSAVQTSTSALIDGNADGPRVDVEFHLEATMAVPPWKMGSLSPQKGETYHHPDEERIEQLFRAKGTVRVEDQELIFNGSGFRVRRKGIRRLGESEGASGRGHCWQTALFPSGKAFGFNIHAPREDGVPPLNDGYLFTGDGSLIPAYVVRAPWLRSLQPTREDVSFVLESELGTTTIQGETVISVFDMSRPRMPNWVVYQGCCRFSWDGEETYGMSERSFPRDKIEHVTA
jgi:hypothetical protein